MSQRGENRSGKACVEVQFLRKEIQKMGRAARHYGVMSFAMLNPAPSFQISKRSHAEPLATNKHLLAWVSKVAELTKPAAIHWVDGSQEEYDELCAQMVKSGTFIQL